jgi:hypothetical protein
MLRLRRYVTLALVCAIAPRVSADSSLHTRLARLERQQPEDQAAADGVPTTCIALMLPSVQGAEGSATDIGNGVRDLFASFLNGPAIKTIGLDARLEAQAIEEARQKSCGTVLVMTLTVKHGSGGLMSRAIGQGLGTAALYAPIPGASAAAAAARSAAIGGAQTISTLASSTKAKDELQLEYRLAGGANAAAAARTEKAKARSDREDLLTPLAERVSKSILASVARP